VNERGRREEGGVGGVKKGKELVLHPQIWRQIYASCVTLAKQFSKIYF